MSKDRPRKEKEMKKDWRDKIEVGISYGQPVVKIDGEYIDEENILVDFIEQEIEKAKTEAKIEVLQEVLDESEKLAVAEVEHLKKLAQITGSSWHYSSLGILGRTLEEKLDNLKKKKK